MEKRRFPRFAARFTTLLDRMDVPEGEGTVINLSRGGCCVATTLDARPGAIFRLHIRISEDESPIQIDRAIVHWHLTTYVGMEFLAISQGEEAKLSSVLGRLAKESAPLP